MSIIIDLNFRSLAAGLIVRGELRRIDFRTHAFSIIFIIQWGHAICNYLNSYRDINSKSTCSVFASTAL